MCKSLFYKHITYNIKRYPHMLDLSLHPYCWLLVRCIVIHILWITFVFLMNNIMQKLSYLCITNNPGKIIAPVKNCCISSHRLLLQNYKDTTHHLTEYKVFLCAIVIVYIICQYCRRMMYLDIGSFFNSNSALDFIRMNI